MKGEKNECPISFFFQQSCFCFSRPMPHRQKTLETAAATAASAYRRLLRAATSLPEGPVRSKAVANVRSLGREGGGASPATTAAAAKSRGDIRAGSLTASDADSASLLFHWVSRLPKVRLVALEREERTPEARASEGSGERERANGKRSEHGIERRRALFHSFVTLSLSQQTPSSTARWNLHDPNRTSSPPF